MVRLTDGELLSMIQRNSISQAGQKEIQRVRGSQPSRRVQQGRGNMSVRYPSHKMEVVIQAESNKVEYPFVILLEQDDRVYEYYDQPPEILCTSVKSNGRRSKYWQTPDYFVIMADYIGWVECKKEEELVELAKESPHLYARLDEKSSTDNYTSTAENCDWYNWHSSERWRYLPGSEYAARCGLQYRVFSSAQIPWVFLGNVMYLADYLRPNRPPVDEEIAAFVKSIIREDLGITLAELLDRTSQQFPAEIDTIAHINANTISELGKVADVINMLIITGGIYADLHANRLTERYRVPIYSDVGAARASIYRSQSFSPGQLL